jgi:hypothetical protein
VAFSAFTRAANFRIVRKTGDFSPVFQHFTRAHPLLLIDYAAKRRRFDERSPADLKRFNSAVSDHGIEIRSADAQDVGSVPYRNS